MRTWLLALLACALLPAQSKPRLIVLTDIGGDPDDQQSMIRLMTYSNEFDIEGLIASASGTPNELKVHVVRPDLIREIVNAYGQVRSNLARHATGYPETNRLRGAIKSGNPKRGEANIGEDCDTEGSRWITTVADRSDTRPLNIAIWGGPTELAQALWRARKERTPAEVKQFVSKLRVHAIGHQDDSGPWILANFPDLFYVLSSADAQEVLGRPPGSVDKRLSVYRGMYLGGDESLTSREWIDTHVRNSHGPLGALYPPKTWTAPNPHSALKEGDTPSWFYFLANGLSDSEHPEWGGWGGRFRRVRDNYYNDADEGRESVWRWRPAFQNDFQARMDWCADSSANHAPLAVLNGDKSRGTVRISAKPGGRVRLSAAGSRDPDGHALTFRWFSYPESGVEASGESIALSPVHSVHVILEVRDNGDPPLTSFRRAIIEVSQ